MKKIFLALCIAAVSAGSAFAQDNDEGHISRFKYHRSYFHRHEFGLTWGISSRSDRAHRFSDYVEENQYRYLLDKDHIDIVPFSLSGHYMYHFNDRLALGGLLSCCTTYEARVTRSIYEAPSTPQDRWRLVEERNGDILGNYFSLMPMVKYTWLISKRVQLYSKVGLGGDVQWFRLQGAGCGTHNDVKFQFGYQVTPVGIEFGKKTVRFFMEVGYGSEGIMMVGVNCHLGKEEQ
ncbi:MAG: outer membrane beta-barrel protein [Bacteroidaceae bacterium]|nr:outer membrane beta-barrel protein [Bacteroidaceae bacterium]MBR1801237.1 outer membrane beta-barrel protein [Bacteroidaceae bacterium]